jgi:hypothetical protein
VDAAIGQAVLDLAELIEGDVHDASGFGGGTHGKVKTPLPE